MTRRIVLASSSPYRREQLARLGKAFDVDAADLDETPVGGDTQGETALRLAQAKARHVARRQTDALVIGADQVAECDGLHIGKPGSHARALQQLLRMQGREVRFHSAVAVVDSRDGAILSRNVQTVVHFRRLDEAALDRYLRLDQPYDCAGSAKIEGLGICLVERVDSDDPSALIGLPLIALTGMLRHFGVQLP